MACRSNCCKLDSTYKAQRGTELKQASYKVSYTGSNTEDNIDYLKAKAQEQEEIIHAMEEDLDIYERKISVMQDDNRELWSMVNTLKKKLDDYVERNDKAVEDLEKDLSSHKKSTDDRLNNIKQVNNWTVNTPVNFTDWGSPSVVWQAYNSSHRMTDDELLDEVRNDPP